MRRNPLFNTQRLQIERDHPPVRSPRNKEVGAELELADERCVALEEGKAFPIQQRQNEDASKKRGLKGRTQSRRPTASQSCQGLHWQYTSHRTRPNISGDNAPAERVYTRPYPRPTPIFNRHNQHLVPM